MTARMAICALYEIVGSCYPQVPSVLEYAVRNISPEETLRIARTYGKQTDFAYQVFSEAYGNRESIYALFRTLSPEVVYAFNCRLVIIDAYLKSSPAYMELPISPHPTAFILDAMIDLYHRIEPQHEMLVRCIYQQVLSRLRTTASDEEISPNVG